MNIIFYRTLHTATLVLLVLLLTTPVLNAFADNSTDSELPEGSSGGNQSSAAVRTGSEAEKNLIDRDKDSELLLSSSGDKPAEENREPGPDLCAAGTGAELPVFHEQETGGSEPPGKKDINYPDQDGAEPESFGLTASESPSGSHPGSGCAAMDESFGNGEPGSIRISSVSGPEAQDMSQEFITITTFAEFDTVRSNPGGHYKLGADIAMEGLWTPVGSSAEDFFSGIFDGQGFTIRGLVVDQVLGYGGLFGYVIGAVLKNINLEDVDLSAGSRTGGLVGYAKDSVIENCTVTGTVRGTDNVGGLAGSIENSSLSDCSMAGRVETTAEAGTYVGGLVGISHSSTIKTSSAECRVSGKNGVGGLVGYMWVGSTVINSYAAGSISGTDNVGGLIGRAWRNSVIENSYSSSLVDGSGSNIGGLVGSAHSSITGDCPNNYWDIEASSQPASAVGAGKTTKDMMSLSTYEGWDFNDTWFLADGEMYPVLLWQLTEPAPGPDPDPNPILIQTQNLPRDPFPAFLPEIRKPPGSHRFTLPPTTLHSLYISPLARPGLLTCLRPTCSTWKRCSSL
jgi:hypothetical protein